MKLLRLLLPLCLCLLLNPGGLHAISGGYGAGGISNEGISGGGGVVAATASPTPSPTPTPTPTPSPTPTPTPTPTPGPGPQYAGTYQLSSVSYGGTSSVAASDTTSGDYQFMVVSTAATATYNGQPAGWSIQCNSGVGDFVMVHENGASEPSSNTWAGTNTSGNVQVYQLFQFAATSVTAVDGCIMNHGAGALNPSATGASDLNVVFGNSSSTTAVSPAISNHIVSTTNNGSDVGAWYFSGTPIDETISGGTVYLGAYVSLK